MRKLTVSSSFRTSFLASLMLLGVSACCRQPEVPLRLDLQLAHTKVKRGQSLWYKLQIANVGCRPILIEDPFWFDQYKLVRNRSSRPESRNKTYFEVTGPDGREFAPYFSWGQHGEWAIWGNDCGSRPCTTPRFDLKPGQTVTASPSVISPERRERWFKRLTGKDISQGNPAERAAYEKWWREGMLDLMKKRGTAPDPTVPAGHRILEGYFTRAQEIPAGKYRIKAVYQPYSDSFMAENAQHPAYRDENWGLPKGTKVYRFESAQVEFEVIP